MTPAEITQAIADERSRQSRKWIRPHPWGTGDCSSADVPEVVKATVLAEECGEVARAVLDHGPSAGPNRQLRTELVQVAAVCTAWLEGIA